MLVAAFLVGLPIFFEVGFIILVPLVWSLTRETKRSLLFYGLPMAAALTVTHSLVPPHPAPAAASQLTRRRPRRTILYGIVVSIPMVIVGRNLLRHVDRKADSLGVPEIAPRRRRRRAHGPPPPVPMVVLLLILPVLLIFVATARHHGQPAVPQCAPSSLGTPSPRSRLRCWSPLYFFGLRRGLNRNQAAKMATDSLAPMGALLCIMGGGGAFKQIIVDSGAGRLSRTSC